MKKPKRVHYINNKDFLKSLVEYKASHILAVAEGKIPPRLPEYIGEAFYSIANRLSSKYIFNGYPYKDEMIGDGIENSVRVALNFDAERSDNPFAYFTQIIYNAFLRRIKTEKKYLYTKLLTYKDFHETLETIPDDFKLVFESQPDTEFDRFADEYITNYEKRMEPVIEDENLLTVGHPLGDKK